MKILALSTLLVSAACHGQGHSHALRYAHDVGFKFTAPAAGAPEQIWLNLGASVDQMVVTWITAASANTTVQFGTTPGSLTSTATGNQSTYTAGAYTSGFIHRATMAGLKAASTVYYRVSGPSGTWSDVITFNVSRSGPVYPFKLAVLGDIGQTNNSNATVNYVLASQQVESVVIAGCVLLGSHYQIALNDFRPILHMQVLFFVSLSYYESDKLLLALSYPAALPEM